MAIEIGTPVADLPLSLTGHGCSSTQVVIEAARSHPGQWVPIKNPDRSKNWPIVTASAIRHDSNGYRGCGLEAAARNGVLYVRFMGGAK